MTRRMPPRWPPPAVFDATRRPPARIVAARARAGPAAARACQSDAASAVRCSASTAVVADRARARIVATAARSSSWALAMVDARADDAREAVPRIARVAPKRADASSCRASDPPSRDLDHDPVRFRHDPDCPTAAPAIGRSTADAVPPADPRIAPAIAPMMATAAASAAAALSDRCAAACRLGEQLRASRRCVVSADGRRIDALDRAQRRRDDDPLDHVRIRLAQRLPDRSLGFVRARDQDPRPRRRAALREHLLDASERDAVRWHLMALEASELTKTASSKRARQNCHGRIRNRFSTKQHTA